MVVAGGVDLHAVDEAAVHTEDGDAGVHGLPELVLQLGGVGADQHDGVGAGGGDVLNAAGQLRKVVGSVDDIDLGALGGQVGLQVAHHLVGGDGGHVGGHDGDSLPRKGAGCRFLPGRLFRRSRGLGRSAAAGGQGQDQHQCGQQRDKLFHIRFLLVFLDLLYARRTASFIRFT